MKVSLRIQSRALQASICQQIKLGRTSGTRMSNDRSRLERAGAASRAGIAAGARCNRIVRLAAGLIERVASWAVAR